MSNPLNGADARPFNSSNFVSPYAAETYPLASVLNALAFNDPEHVVRASACGALSGLTVLHADMSAQIEAARAALRSSR